MTLTEVSLPIVDADAHVIETPSTWSYLEQSEESFRPQLISTDSEPIRRYWFVNGRLSGIPSAATTDDEFEKRAASSKRNVKVDLSARTMENIDLRLSHMTELGIDIQVLHNSIWLEQVTNRPDIELALSRSWNRWLGQIWERGGGRLRWTCVVPVLDLSKAEDEMKYAKDHGAVGVCIRPFDSGIMIADPYFYPLYEQAEKLDLPIIIHIGNGDPAFVDQLSTRYGMDGFPMYRVPTMLSCYGILKKNVPAKFPNLRWGFIEASAQWIPWAYNELQRRMDYEFTQDNNPFKNGNIFISAQTDDDFDYITKYVGEDVLVIGTDYGHLDPSSEIDAITTFRKFALDEEMKKKILSTNAIRLYNL